MNEVKKTVYTLCVNNYEPEITALTFPLMKEYAEKIGAKFYIIDEIKFPEAPCLACEKFQIPELAEQFGDDWSIFFDADTLVHPDMFDPTTVLNKDTTMSNGSDFSPNRFTANKYFLRDGRFIGKGNWFAVVSDWCRDYWNHDDGFDFADQIFPILPEINFGIDAEHLVDDYMVSRNIARFGLKHVLLPDMKKDYEKMHEGLLYHQYLHTPEQKVIQMNKVMQSWGL